MSVQSRIVSHNLAVYFLSRGPVNFPRELRRKLDQGTKVKGSNLHLVYTSLSILRCKHSHEVMDIAYE